MMENLYFCRKDCCPKMMYDPEENAIFIEDDFGARVQMTPVQFEALKDAFEKKFGRLSENA